MVEWREGVRAMRPHTAVGGKAKPQRNAVQRGSRRGDPWDKKPRGEGPAGMGVRPPSRVPS